MNPKRKVSKRAAQVRFVNEEMYGGDEGIRPSHASVRRGLPNIGRRNLDECGERRNARRGPHSMKYRTRNGSQSNHESHVAKYGRQDERHQLVRLRTKEERLDAFWKRQFQTKFGHPSNENTLDHLFAMECLEYGSHEWYVSEEEQEEHRRADVLDEWPYALEAEEAWFELSMRETMDDWREELFADDSYYYDDRYDDSYHASEDFAFSFGRDDLDAPHFMWEDIFEGYGESDRDLDTSSHGQASQLCFSDRRPTRRMLNDLASL